MTYRACAHAQACQRLGYCASAADLRINCTFCINQFAEMMAAWQQQPRLLTAHPEEARPAVAPAPASWGPDSLSSSGTNMWQSAGGAPQHLASEASHHMCL